MHSNSSAAPHRRRRAGRRRLPFVLATVTAMTATLLPFAPVTAAEPAPAPVDGKTSASAAASCWEIKQKDPASKSGVYWLVTPQMSEPGQFYCDQVTDGGGWVLVGRGRNDWKEYYEGVGTPAEVSSTVTGPAAFAPKQLPSRTVDALLNGQRPDELEDGIRLRRARDAQGSTWQEGRMKISAKPHWNWTFGSRTPVTSFSLVYGTGVASGTSGTTNDFGTNNGTARVRFQDVTETSWQRGFRYGDEITGSNTSTTYHWTPAAGGKGAIPFTQMYVRPKVTQQAFEGKAIPAAGTPAAAQRALPNSGAEPTTWGAVERADGQDGEMNTEVQALEQIGSTVFAGGNFKAMQKSSTGTGRVAQSYLAAFDVATGELRTGFRPVFDGQVKALTELPGGKLAVGGRFSTVNGVRTPGFVVLDAATGQVDGSWNLKVENLLTNGVLQVRTLDVEGDWLYLGGAFTHLSGGDATGRVYARSGARVKISTRTPDASWNPEFNGTVASLDASPKGDRLYAAGYFNQSQGASAFRLAAVRTTAGAPLETWNWEPSVAVDYADPGQTAFQLAVREQGGTVWAGGAEHSMFGYDRSTFQRTSWGITSLGGDMQAITSTDSTVFGACHCFHWFNAGADKWIKKGGNTQPVTVADRINAVGAWDAASGTYLPDFNPELKGFGGWGVWATLVDSRGVLWVGGDINRAVSRTGAPQWAGGFLRFAPRDAAAPAAPSNLEVATGAAEDTLTWTASPEAGVRYQVLRNDRPVATVTGTTATVAHLDGARYAVRAADAADNRSASTPVVTAGDAPEEPVEQPPADGGTLVAAGSEWRYHHDKEVAPGEGWRGTGFDDAAWKKGSAVLGWGSDQVRTTLVTDGTRPIVTQFRRTVDVADASQIATLKLTTRADDGVAVWVNGHEVLRSNVAEGSLEDHPWALSPRRTATAVAEPVEVEVPAWMLRDGQNVVAAQMHSNWTNTTDTSFDLEVEAVAGTQPQPPADQPAPEDPQEPVEEPADPADPVEEPEQPADPDALVAEGSDWRYHHDRANPPARDWAAPDFDDAAWKQGSAVLGWGSEQLGTTLVADGTRPLTTYFRKDVEVADASTVEKLVLTTRADDGVAVYVNGEEVVRSNLPDGVLASGTYATAPRRTATAVAEPVRVEVPGWMLRDGGNVIAAEMHSNWTNTTDASFDLRAEVVEGVQPEAPAEVPDVIARGAEWSYRHADSAPEEDWEQAGTVLDWADGRAPFGWGTPVATELTTDGRRPLATQFRKEFTVADPAALGELLLTTRADDGIVVKVNGKEITRSNMPEGELDWTKYALSARRTTAALADPVTAVVPVSALKPGVNVITVSVHVDYRSTPDASFDLELTPRPEDAA
ncbi:fibrinogen-like YCDxxxxGGGW domain-containing protein [Kocuria flava]|uniref:fibrinogen-like YCDxxxxGGGW domain-containing protein n=1 Tax=Kocuria flava TaxID=446860 RepID=UPI003F1D56E9